jgi:hypothetical protein
MGNFICVQGIDDVSIIMAMLCSHLSSISLVSPGHMHAAVLGIFADNSHATSTRNGREIEKE